MKRFAFGLLGIALATVLVGALGCKGPTPAGSIAQSSGSASSHDASQSAKAARQVEKTVVLNGLIVTLTIPTGPATDATGRHQFRLRAENSTDATMSLHVIGNTPQLLNAQGVRVTNVVAGSGFGPGAHPAPAPGAAPKRPRPGVADGIPGHTYATGLLVTKDYVTGRGYSVKWDLGPGRVAIFKVP